MWKIHRFLLRATLTVAGRSFAVVARNFEGDERTEMFGRFIEADPAYDEYTERTTREIPVFELRPEGS